MKLSKRLQMNVSLVPQGARVADIGCDHGYAAIWLIQNQVAEKMIAMDINEGPIARAKEHIRRESLEKQIECRRSNGMEKLEPGEVDTLMIAGMGGPLMIDILEGHIRMCLKKYRHWCCSHSQKSGLSEKNCQNLGLNSYGKKPVVTKENFTLPCLQNGQKTRGIHTGTMCREPVTAPI